MTRLTRLLAWLRRADDWWADRILPESVPFSPVCRPVAARREVAGRVGPANCPPGHTPTTRKATR